MNYKPKLKKKKGFHFAKKVNTLPFPVFADDRKILGVFDGFSVEISDSENFELLHRNGCFGKGSLSRSAPAQLVKSKNETHIDVQADRSLKETLVLDLEESFFLTRFAKILEIQDLNGKTIDDLDLFAKFCQIKTRFVETFVAYLYLKSEEWIVKSGIKFGSHFLIYKESIQLYHASFVVIISNDFDPTTKNVQVVQRVAESADKDVMLLEVCKPTDLDMKNLSEVLLRLNDFQIQEIILKRFDLAKNQQ